MASKRWTVDITIDEQGQVTMADARLRRGGDELLHGRGSARRNPSDVDVPEIGDELAAARALSQLAHELRQVAGTDIEGVTHEHAHLHHTEPM